MSDKEMSVNEEDGGGAVEKDWITQAGLRAVVVLFKSPFGGWQWRCGYVGVPKTHPWFGKDYAATGPIDCDVHCGLTYSEDLLPMLPQVTDLWWFGYDCAHAGDGLFGDGELKTLEFGIEQCESLAKQLAQAKGD